jgi:CheY-like chemotaxis protein
MAKKILLVDDANLFLELEKRLFKDTGSDLMTAHSGAEALKVVSQTPPDIILLDHEMPDMSGDKVCAAIKSNPRTAHIPVIMVTAFGNPERLEACQRAGCDDFLTKPVKRNVLQEKIVDLLKIPRRRAMRVLVRIKRESQPNEVATFGTSLDVSVSGMKLRSSEKYEIGEKLIVHFYLQPEQSIDCSTTVMRRERVEMDYAYGVQFLDLPANMRQAIERSLALTRPATK